MRKVSNAAQNHTARPASPRGGRQSRCLHITVPPAGKVRHIETRSIASLRCGHPASRSPSRSTGGPEEADARKEGSQPRCLHTSPHPDAHHRNEMPRRSRTQRIAMTYPRRHAIYMSRQAASHTQATPTASFLQETNCVCGRYATNNTGVCTKMRLSNALICTKTRFSHPANLHQNEIVGRPRR